jgi:hypothetical protein
VGPLRELLATVHREALEFFFQRLKDVSGPDVDRAELLYNASVLAHYAPVSTHASVDLSARRTSARSSIISSRTGRCSKTAS